MYDNNIYIVPDVLDNDLIRNDIKNTTHACYIYKENEFNNFTRCDNILEYVRNSTRNFIEGVIRDMEFQICDRKGNIIDQNLSYEEALMWTDQPFGNRFTIEPMKEDNQNDCNSL